MFPPSTLALGCPNHDSSPPVIRLRSIRWRSVVFRLVFPVSFLAPIQAFSRELVSFFDFLGRIGMRYRRLHLVFSNFMSLGLMGFFRHQRIGVAFRLFRKVGYVLGIWPKILLSPPYPNHGVSRINLTSHRNLRPLRNHCLIPHAFLES